MAYKRVVRTYCSKLVEQHVRRKNQPKRDIAIQSLTNPFFQLCRGAPKKALGDAAQKAVARKGQGYRVSGGSNAVPLMPGLGLEGQGEA